jgi:DNA-binding transcriptional LysR family regulator
MLRWKKASGTSRGIELSDLQHMLLEHHFTLQDGKDVSDWNEFRIVLAIGRAGSLVGAAKDLGHDHSTIFRWLNAIERRRGVQLFDRTSSQYTPTEAGFQMVMAAERLETEILAIDRSITGQDARLSGKLKITSSETLAYRILNEILADFRRKHDGIELELLVDNRQLELLRREADIAIRATRPDEGELFGRKIASTPWTFYGSSHYLSDRGRPTDLPSLSDHAVIGWDSSAVATASKWLTANISPRAFAYRSSSLISQLMAVKAGLGLALLPCYLGDLESDIERVQEPLKELTRELWLVTHKDLRKTARVRAFFDHVGAGLLARSALLEGECGRPSVAADQATDCSASRAAG